MVVAAFMVNQQNRVLEVRVGDRHSSLLGATMPEITICSLMSAILQQVDVLCFCQSSRSAVAEGSGIRVKVRIDLYSIVKATSSSLAVIFQCMAALLALTPLDKL